MAFRYRQAAEDEIEIQRDHNEDGPHKADLDAVAVTNAAYLLAQLSSQKVPCKTFLDVGCRDGAVLASLTAGIQDAVGVDIVLDFVKAAWDKGCKAQLADASILPFAAEEFDVVFCHQVLEHCPNPFAVLSEIDRVAKRAAFIGVPIESLADFQENLSHHVSATSPQDWIQLVTAVLAQPDWLPLSYYWNTGMPYFNMIFLRKQAAQ